MRCSRWVAAISILCVFASSAASHAADDGFTARLLAPGVTMVSDDQGVWGGPSMGTSHQERPTYQTKKQLSTACVDATTWDAAVEARVRVFFFIQDISAMRGTFDGLDESFEIVVNGHSHVYQTSAGFPARAERSDPLQWAWTDFAVPKEQLNHGDNEIIVRKMPSEDGKNDDYIYVGIDNSVRLGHSFMTADGKTWQTDQLNAIGATGEYMVRLLLIDERGLTRTTRWQPGAQTRDDTADPLVLAATRDTARQRHELALASSAFATRSQTTACFNFTGEAPNVQWYDEAGNPIDAHSEINESQITSTATYGYHRPAKLQIGAVEPGMVRNGGFELATGDQPDAWRVHSAAEEPGANVVATDAAHSGNRSMRMRHTGQNYSWSKQYFTVKPHTRYTAAAWIKTDSVDPVENVGSARMVVAPGRTGNTMASAPAISGTHDWARYVVTFDTGEWNEINIILYLHQAAGTAWFDDVTLTEGDTPAPEVARARPTLPDITSVTFDYVPSYLPRLRNDMTPAIAPPAGKPIDRDPACRVTDDRIVLENAHLSCTFKRDGSLSLSSLVAHVAGKDVLQEADESGVLLVEIDGRQYTARDFAIRNVTPLDGNDRGVVVDLFLAEHELAAALTLAIDADPEVHMGLTLTNEGAQAVDFMVAFPHMGGISISNDPADDYYLFPLRGGVINRAPVQLRSAYGAQTCWWQMIDLYSPAKGAGVYMRCADTLGMFKLFTMAKGRDAAFSHSDMAPGVDVQMHFRQSLGASDYSAMTVEYLRRRRGPGESFAVPSAAIGVHAGDWHAAMERYSDWAHRVWDWRPLPSRMHDVWNIAAPGWGKRPLFQDGKFIDWFMTERYDFAELMSFWEWAKAAMWNVPFDEVEERLGRGGQYGRMLDGYVVDDPVTGEKRFVQNWGDYDYNSSFGGLPALRQYIARIKQAGIMPTFYVAGYLACATTRAGQTYGEQYGIMPSQATRYAPVEPEGYLTSYGVYNVCPDNDGWSDYLAQTLRRLAVDTGIEGVRFDEFGYAKAACVSTKHEHLFAEPGHNEFMRAQVNIYRKVREQVDPVDPDFALSAEHYGYDCLARYMDWALDYDVRNNPAGIRIMPMTLFRFYFPECKTAEFNDGDPLMPEYRLFNAWAVMHPNGPELYHRTLLDNGDAFDGRDIEPLVRTLQRDVFAHRFASESKTIHTFYNASGFTISGPLLLVNDEPGRHWVDLLSGVDVEMTHVDGGSALAMTIDNNKAACVALLPRELSAAIDGNTLTVTVREPRPGLSLVIASATDAKLARMDAVEADNHFELDATFARGSRYMVKLFDGKYLRDMTSFIR